MTQDTLQLLGAGGFGALIGWYVYYINRYRKSDVQVGDITSIVGAVGGAAVLALFPAKTGLFGAYGVGLFVGFFGYFLSLVVLVGISENFNADWFLDGRRKRPVDPPYYVPGDVAQTAHPMAAAEPIDSYGAALSTAISTTASSVATLMTQGSHAALVAPQRAFQATGRAADIINVCEAEWAVNKSDCSEFVQAVAAHFSLTLNGDADAIVDQIQIAANGWELVPNGVAAKNAADNGKLVIAGLKGSAHQPVGAHGHVVVVVSGPLDAAYHRYPTAYWGTLGGVGERAKTINWAWRRNDRDRVIYSCHTV